MKINLQTLSVNGNDVQVGIDLELPNGFTGGDFIAVLTGFDVPADADLSRGPFLPAPLIAPYVMILGNNMIRFGFPAQWDVPWEGTLLVLNLRKNSDAARFEMVAKDLEETYSTGVSDKEFNMYENESFAAITVP